MKLELRLIKSSGFYINPLKNISCKSKSIVNGGTINLSRITPFPACIQFQYTNGEIMGDRSEDRQILGELDKDTYADLTFMHLRNMWAVDGLYYLGIEERFGTEAATEIDAFVWKIMGKIEARRLQKLLGLGNDLDSMIKGLKYSGWAMDLEDKDWEEADDGVLLRTIRCRVQLTRQKDELEVFPCKVVRWGFLKAFAKVFNENIEVLCNQCPPDELEEGKWCEWKFIMKNEGV